MRSDDHPTESLTTSPDERGVDARLDETIVIWNDLHAQLDTAGHWLLRRLDQLHSEAIVDESDRVLAIAGRLCMQFEAPDLFRRIYATALDGCQIAPGDERCFLALHRPEET